MADSIMGAPVLSDDLEAINAMMRLHFPDSYQTDVFLAALGMWLGQQLKAKGENYAQSWIHSLRFHTLSRRLPRP